MTDRVVLVAESDGRRLEHEVTPTNCAEVLARLASLVPHDFVWYTTPIRPRR